MSWVLAVVAAGCLSWSLGIDGWRLCACMVGITLLQLGHDIVAVNERADR